MYLLIRLFIYLLPSGVIRTKWIEKMHIFRKNGSNFYFCPRKLPADPKLIEFGNNVAVATDVMFINHDVSQKVFNRIKREEIPKFYGCISIGDNVFIGSKVTILPNVYICDNVFIAAGALVTKPITVPGVYGGVPAKRIGDMDDLYEKRLRIYKPLTKGLNEKELIKVLWKDFETKKNEVDYENKDYSN